MGTMLSLLGNARLLGLSLVPLEGEYDQLSSLPGPSLVAMREGDREVFIVLLGLVEGGARTIDPVDGAEQTLCREEFVERWTGDVVVVMPDPEGRRRLERELEARRRRWPHAVFVGSIALAVATAAASLAAAHSGLEAWHLAPVATAGAFVASSWLVLFGASCKVCSRGKIVSGRLPLEWAGVLAYGLLLPALFAISRDDWFVTITCLAAGGHLSLLGLLWRHRVTCKACLVAGSLVIASAVLLVAIAPPPARTGLTAAGLGLLSMLAVIRLRIVQITRRSMALGWASAAAVDRPPPGTARFVVLKHHGCGACALFESALRPALIERFGDSLSFEESFSEAALVTPLIAGVGHDLRIVAMGLGPDGGEYERLETISRALLGRVPAGDLDGLADVSARSSHEPPLGGDDAITFDPAVRVTGK